MPFNGTRRKGRLVEVHDINLMRVAWKFDSAEMYRRMRNTIFCPCPPGDMPYQKRFFVAMLTDCIPVVIRLESGVPGRPSHHPRGRPPIERTYPFADKIDYTRAVLEIQPEDVGNLVQVLEAVPEQQIRSKLAYIAEIRNLLIYDFVGTAERDAFSMILAELQEKAARLRAASSSCPFPWSAGRRRKVEAGAKYTRYLVPQNKHDLAPGEKKVLGPMGKYNKRPVLVSWPADLPGLPDEMKEATTDQTVLDMAAWIYGKTPPAVKQKTHSYM